jgi:hypothetical protein
MDVCRLRRFAALERGTCIIGFGLQRQLAMNVGPAVEEYKMKRRISAM